MAVQTRIYTNHQVTHPGVPFQASMMLDDDGRGNLTLTDSNGPVLTVDAARVDAVIALLQECSSLRNLMTQTGIDLLVGEVEPNGLT